MALWLLLSGCIPITIDTGGKDGGGDNGGNGGNGGTGGEDFVVETYTATSNRTGTFKVDFDVAADEDVVQIVAESTVDGGLLATEYLDDPDGNRVLDWQDWLYGRDSLTEALYALEFANTLNWPVREVDGPLTPGTWTYHGAAVDSRGYYDSDVDVNVYLLKRRDGDFSRGTLHAVIAYADGLEGDREVVRGIEAGAAYWVELYSSVGIDLTIEYTTINVDAAMPDTYEGQRQYQTLMENLGVRGVLMVVGDTIAGDTAIFGEAGGIPGPYWPEPIGAVEVSWIAHAGNDGEFSEEEIYVLGETMGHETGHYLGLFHPVEYGWNYWDALDDTEHCTSMNSCEDAMEDNLMFPYPICNSRSCVRQDVLTGEQAGVMNRYVGVE